MMNNRPAALRRCLVLLTGAVAMALAVGGCAKPSKKADQSTDRAGQVGTDQFNANATASAQPGGTSSARPTGRASATPTRTAASTPVGPQIVSFAVVGNANCGANGPGYSSPGTVTLQWKVTGANSVALSIDNPEIVGGYRSGYGLEVTETLPFGCGGQIGAKVTHKYTIVAVYPGANKVKTLDVSAIYYG